MAMKERQVKKCYNNVLKALDKLGWKYTEIPEKNRVKFNVHGEDLSSTYYLTINAEKEMASLLVVLPYRGPRMDSDQFVKAISIANSRFYNGSFYFDPKTREVVFRLTTLLQGGMELSCECVKYMLDTACDMVDKYDDKLFAVAKDYLSLEDYYQSLDAK